MFDELVSDKVTANESPKFKVETYYAILDVMLNEIRERLFHSAAHIQKMSTEKNLWQALIDFSKITIDLSRLIMIL